MLNFGTMARQGDWLYYYDFSKYRSADFNYDPNWSVRFGKAYNEMLEKVSTIGVLGTLAYLLLALSALLLLARNARREKPEVFLLLAFLSLLVFQFIFLETAVLKFLFGLLLILAASNPPQKRGGRGDGSFPLEERNIFFLETGGKRMAGKIFPALGLFLLLGCSAALLLDVQAWRAEAAYKALSSGDIQALDSSRLEEVTKLHPTKANIPSAFPASISPALTAWSLRWRPRATTRRSWRK
jgi:hypothetical protein